MPPNVKGMTDNRETTTGTMLRGMATVTYWADDLEAAKDWYAELLGTQPYFANGQPGGPVAYYEFRIGDHAAELGLVDRRYAHPDAPAAPGGAVLYWHVDDVHAAVRRLLDLGAKEYDPITPRSAGFVTAAVRDPFGNVLGVMYNPHYLEMLAARRAAAAGAGSPAGSPAG
jgi:predicted enzyme related to lactoylglutathione lyase